MNTTIHEVNFPHHMSCATDGSVVGTHFYNDDTGEEMAPPGVTMQQEGLSIVRVRFAPHYGIGSLAIGPDDTLTLNAPPPG